MLNLPKRPIVVWIAMLILLAYAATLLLPVSIGTYMVATNGWFGLAIVAAGFAALALLAMICTFVSVWAIAKRRSWGRWLGAGSLLFPFLAAWYFESEYADPHWRAFTDFTVDFVYSVTLSMLVVPSALVAVLLNTGDKVRAYFAVSYDEDGKIKVPPPPPDFESGSISPRYWW